MKKVALLAFCISSTIFSYSQFGTATYDNKDFQSFLKTTTYVAMTGDSLYDAELSKAMAKFWKITPYKIVDQKSFESLSKNPQNSVLVLYRTIWDDKIQGMHSDNLSLDLRMGSPTIADNIIVNYKNYTAPLSSFSFVTSKVEDAYKKYYRLQDIVNTMHFCLVKTQSDKLKHTNFAREYFNKDIGVLKTKTLYILKSDLRNDVDNEKVAKNYPYKFKTVTEDELKNATTRDDKNAVYMIMRETYGPVFYDIATHKCVGGMEYGTFEFFRTQDFKDITSFVKKYSK